MCKGLKLFLKFFFYSHAFSINVFVNFIMRFRDGGGFINLGMYKGYYKGLLNEQVLLLYLVKSDTPSCTAPDYDKKHTKMWMLKNNKSDYQEIIST